MIFLPRKMLVHLGVSVIVSDGQICLAMTGADEEKKPVEHQPFLPMRCTERSWAGRSLQIFPSDTSWLFPGMVDLMGFVLRSFDMNKPVCLHVPVRKILLTHIQLAEGDPVFKII